MARYATRFKNQEVVIKETSSDGAWIGIIRRLYKEGDQLFYEIEVENEESPVCLSASSVEWVRARKSVKVLEINKLNLAPLRLMKSSTN